MVYENEEELKKALDSLGFRYGDRFNNCGFVCSIIDSNSGADVFQVSVKTPIAAIRLLPNLLKERQLGVEDVRIILEFAYDVKSRVCKNVNFELSPYIYFKKEKTIDSENEKIDSEKVKKD